VKLMGSSMKRPYYWLAAVSLVAFLVSCAAKPENSITGKWQQVNGTETIEFFKDGRVRSDEQGRNIQGNYKFLDNKRMELTMGGAEVRKNTLVAQVTLSGKELTLVLPGSGELKYKKVQ